MESKFVAIHSYRHMGNDIKSIAASFPNEYELGILDVKLQLSEFSVFEKGIYPENMDAKWIVFILDEVIYFVRSWTKYVTYKIFYEIQDDGVLLKYCYVSRNRAQYNSIGIDNDVKVLKRLLRAMFNRESIYEYPEMQLPAIKRTMESIPSIELYIKSIGHSTIKIIKAVHDFSDISGVYDELKKIVDSLDDQSELISLYLQHRDTRKAMTFYYDLSGELLLASVYHN